jgi:hypothetical protein
MVLELEAEPASPLPESMTGMSDVEDKEEDEAAVVVDMTQGGSCGSLSPRF